MIYFETLEKRLNVVMISADCLNLGHLLFQKVTL